ncbi:hypothetical protein ONZ51_g12843 [Trametes cubensis]|uniref:Uncharacterized protein n=1 Tax=Trametes cubensis TaxID=1111947 RepID=A0AAD7X538_9APHY|nr:hypothetical protein ONZ51_g12843 [Trametes cubensis]
MPGDSQGSLPLETSQFVGAIVAAVAYGLHIAVFWRCVYYILPQATRRRTYANVGLLAYVVATFSFGTVALACYARLAQLMFVDHRTYTGGPSAWLSSQTGDAVSVLGTVSFMLCVLLANGLLLWRTYMLWESRISVLALPLLLYLADTGLAIPTLLQLARPHSDLWAHITVPLILLYFSLAISLTALLHLFLVGRLMYMSYRATSTIGKEHAVTYISIYTMIIESAVPYTVTSLVFIACYARNSNAQNIVLPILSQVTCINPELLILRVARGRAVSSVKASEPGPSTIRFRRPVSMTVALSVPHSTTSGRPIHPEDPVVTTIST